MCGGIFYEVTMVRRSEVSIQEGSISCQQLFGFVRKTCRITQVHTSGSVLALGCGFSAGFRVWLCLLSLVHC